MQENLYKENDNISERQGCNDVTYIAIYYGKLHNDTNLIVNILNLMLNKEFYFLKENLQS